MRYALLLFVAVLTGCQTHFDRSLLVEEGLPPRREFYEHPGYELGYADFTSVKKVSTFRLNGHEITIVEHPIHWLEDLEKLHAEGLRHSPFERLGFHGPHIVHDGGPFSLWYKGRLLGWFPWMGPWAVVGQDPERAVVVALWDNYAIGGPIQVDTMYISGESGGGLVFLDLDQKGRRFTCEVSTECYENHPLAITFTGITKGAPEERAVLLLNKGTLEYRLLDETP